MTHPECPPGMESVAHLEAHLWPESHTVSTCSVSSGNLSTIPCIIRNATVKSSQRFSQVCPRQVRRLPGTRQGKPPQPISTAETNWALPQPLAAPCRPSRSSTQCPRHSTTPDSSTGLSCVVPETLPARTLEFTEKWRP